MAIINPEFSIAAKKSDRATEWLTRYVEQARIDGWMTRHHDPTLQVLALCLTQAEWVSPTSSDLTPLTGARPCRSTVVCHIQSAHDAATNGRTSDWGTDHH